MLEQFHTLDSATMEAKRRAIEEQTDIYVVQVALDTKTLQYGLKDRLEGFSFYVSVPRDEVPGVLSMHLPGAVQGGLVLRVACPDGTIREPTDIEALGLPPG